MTKPFYVKFEIPEELAVMAYEALKVAQDTGKVRRGTNETTKAIERGVAKLVYIAEDVEPPEIVAHLPLLCEERKIQYIYVPSRIKLGTSTGIDVSAASTCIVEEGDAKDLLQEITNRLERLRKGG